MLTQETIDELRALPAEEYTAWTLILPGMSVENKDDADRFVSVITDLLIEKGKFSFDLAHKRVKEDLIYWSRRNSDNMQLFWYEYFNGGNPVNLKYIKRYEFNGVEYVKYTDAKPALDRYCR